MSKRLGFLIFNFLGLQVTWAACAYGAINSQPLIGAMVGAAYIGLHFLLTHSRRSDLLTLLCLSAIGIALDYINMKFGVITFNSDTASMHFIPVWLVALWAVFSLMIPHSLHWLSKKPLLAVIFGALGGGSSYWLGHKLGAITLGEPLVTSVLIYAVEWAIYMPIAYMIYQAITRSSNTLSVTKQSAN